MGREVEEEINKRSDFGGDEVVEQGILRGEGETDLG